MRVMGSQWLPPEPKMPPGLIELMEGLTRDVLRNNPPNVLEFCTRHMQKLLEIRDGRAPKIPLTLEEKIQRAQEKMRQKAEERRLKYDEAIKEHLGNEPEVTKDQDQNEYFSALEKDVQETVRIPIPIHQDLHNDKEVEISHKTTENDKEIEISHKSTENDKEVEISHETSENNKNVEISHEISKNHKDGALSHETSDSLKKSIEEFDEGINAEDMQLSAENYAEGESNSPKTNSLEEHREVNENNKEVELPHETSDSFKKSIEELNEAMIAETSGDTTKDMQLSTENNVKVESNTPETNSLEDHSELSASKNSEENSLEKHPEIQTEDKLDAHETIDSDKVNESNSYISPDLVRKPRSLEDEAPGHREETTLDVTQTADAQKEESKNSSIDKVLDQSPDDDVNKNKSLESEMHSDSVENKINENESPLETGEDSSNYKTENIVKSTQDTIESGNDSTDGLSEKTLNHGNSTDKETDMIADLDDSVNKQLFLDNKNKENVSDTHELDDSVNKQLFLDNKNTENVSDTHERKTSSKEYRDVNLELKANIDQNKERKITFVDRKNEKPDINSANIDVNINPANIDLANIDPAKAVNQASHTNEKTTENERIESKETIVTPQITLALTEANENLSEVSEPECEKKIIITLAVPANNIINMNDGDLMHKTENSDSNIALSFQESVKNDSLPEITVENKMINEKENFEGKLKESEIGTDSTIENNLIYDKEKLNGKAEENPAAELNSETQIVDLHIVENPCKVNLNESQMEKASSIENNTINQKQKPEENLPTQLNGETQIIDLNIVENPCSENNSQIEGIEILDEDNSESDFILKNAEIDDIINQSDSSNITEESTSKEKLIEKVDNIDDENKIDELSTQSNSTSNMDLETAAVTIQKHFRMFLFKSRDREGGTFDDSLNDDLNSTDEEADKKLVEYQMSPLNKERRGLCRMESVLQTVNEEKSLSLSTDDSASSAATVIQARVRGFLVRKRLNSYKTASISTSDNRSMSSDEQKEKKTVLNIHIDPEDFITRDESILESIDLSLDGSPPSSTRHPLGYDKSEPRKQLKREDAVQSVSPPTSNNGEKNSVQVDINGEKNCKEGVDNGEKISEDVESIKNAIEIDQSEQQKDDCITEPAQDAGSCGTTPSKSTTIETVIEIHEEKAIHATEVEEVNHEESDISRSSDGSDVVTPLDDNSTDSDSTSKLIHSGEFHDILLPSPTQISRSNTTVVREFKIVLGFFLLWK